MDSSSPVLLRRIFERHKLLFLRKDLKDLLIDRVSVLIGQNFNHTALYQELLNDVHSLSIEDIDTNPAPVNQSNKYRAKIASNRQIALSTYNQVKDLETEELEIVEMQHVLKILVRESFNQVATCNKLKITVRGLRFKLERWKSYSP